MKKPFFDKRRFLSVFAILVIIIVFIFGFSVELFSNEETSSLSMFFNGSSIAYIAGVLLVIGLFSWIIVSRFLLKGKLSKTKIGKKHKK